LRRCRAQRYGQDEAVDYQTTRGYSFLEAGKIVVEVVSKAKLREASKSSSWLRRLLAYSLGDLTLWRLALRSWYTAPEEGPAVCADY
jgi:hypothetical protein